MAYRLNVFHGKTQIGELDGEAAIPAVGDTLPPVRDGGKSVQYGPIEKVGAEHLTKSGAKLVRSVRVTVGDATVSKAGKDDDE